MIVIREHAGNQARPETERSSLSTQTQSDSVSQSDAINSTVVLVIVIREHAGNQARPETERSSLSTQTSSTLNILKGLGDILCELIPCSKCLPNIPVGIPVGQ